MSTATIYFIQAPGRIKVGFSQNFEKRLAQLEQADIERLTTIATIPGTRSLERQIHERIAAHRIKGEWFSDCPQVWEVITENVGRSGAPAGFQGQNVYYFPVEVRQAADRDEAGELIRFAAATAPAGSTMITRIVHAAAHLGWPYERTRKIWWKERRRVESWEMDILRGLKPSPAPSTAGWSQGLVA